MSPQSTPRECILLETGMWDIELMMHEKQITYLQKITQGAANTTRKISLDPTTTWNKQVTKTIRYYNITTDQLLNMTKEQLKNTLKQKLTAENIKRIKVAALRKSKVSHLLEYKEEVNLGKKPKYLKELLTRSQAAIIFATRARMIKIKANYPNMFQDRKCRWCNTENETQEHIINQCTGLTRTTNLDPALYNKIMSNDTENLMTEAKNIGKILKQLKNTRRQMKTKNKKIYKKKNIYRYIKLKLNKKI